MAFNLKDIFIQSYKAANPEINVESGFQVYDTMIDPNARAFESLDAGLHELEDNIDYSNFFDDNGNLVSDAKFEILRNNLFLGDGMAAKGRGTFLFEFSALQSSILISSPLIISKDGVEFIVSSGTYVLPVNSISSRKIRYGLTAVSMEIGPDVTAVMAGDWNVVSGQLPLDCLRVFTTVSTAAGSGNAGQLTLDNLPLLMSRKSLDSKDSITAALNSITSAAGIIPDKVSVVGYEDQEYQSGIVPFQDEDDEVKQFRFGGYADTRFHKGCVAAEFYYDGSDTYAEELYRYKMNNPVYAVISVRTWIEGNDGADVPFTFDYVHNIITTAHKKVRVMVLTTDTAAWDYVRQSLAALYSSGGSIRLLPYYSIRFYVDTDCGIDAGVVDDVNQCLLNYLDKGPSLYEASFDRMMENIKEVAGLTVTGIKYLYPDGDAGILTSGTVPEHDINYASSEFEVPIPLTILNTVTVGGYSG